MTLRYVYIYSVFGVWTSCERHKYVGCHRHHHYYYYYTIIDPDKKIDHRRLWEYPRWKSLQTEHDSVGFFDISTGYTPSGHIEIKLFYDTTPIMAQNYHALYRGMKGINKISGKPLHQKSSTLYWIILGLMCYGGDFTLGNGSGGESVYGAAKFLSENLKGGTMVMEFCQW